MCAKGLSAAEKQEEEKGEVKQRAQKHEMGLSAAPVANNAVKAACKGAVELMQT